MEKYKIREKIYECAGALILPAIPYSMLEYICITGTGQHFLEFIPKDPVNIIVSAIPFALHSYLGAAIGKMFAEDYENKKKPRR